MVLSPDGAYLLVNSSTVSAGFNDMIEYGESVGLSLTLENVGSDIADDVTVYIYTIDPYITIINEVGSADSIEPNETAIISGLAFDVSGEVPNEHNFEISCIISSGSDSWESNINFIAYAPVLDIIQLLEILILA
jgi:hypothetical protein